LLLATGFGLLFFASTAYAALQIQTASGPKPTFNDEFKVAVGAKNKGSLIIFVNLSENPNRSIELAATKVGAFSPQLAITSGQKMNFTAQNWNSWQNLEITYGGGGEVGQKAKITLAGGGLSKDIDFTAVSSGGDFSIGTGGGTSGGSGTSGGGSTSSGGSVALDTSDEPQTIPLGNAPFKEGLANYISNPDGFVYKTWRVTRGLINVLLVIALLVISFSNITRFNIDTYTVKKALPNLILGVILANASFLIVRYLADIATVATYLFIDLAGEKSFASFLATAAALITADTALTLGAGRTLFVGGVLLVLIFMIITIIGLVWLAFLLYFRLVAIYLLTILAPLAFVAYGIPGLEKYFKMWWQQMIKWMFMVPAMAAVFWLMIVISKAAGGEQSWARLLLMYALFFIAVTIPTRFGGAVIDKASGLFKKGGQFAYAKSQNIGAAASLYGDVKSGKAQEAKRSGLVSKYLSEGYSEDEAKKRAAEESKSAGGGWRALRSAGRIIATPTSVKKALEDRWKIRSGSLSYALTQTEAYKRLAGPEAQYTNNWKGQQDFLQGAGVDTLESTLESRDPDGKLRAWLQEVRDKYGPGAVSELISYPYGSQKTAVKYGGLEAVNNDYGKLGGFLSVLKMFNRESQRVQRLDRGAMAWIGGGGTGSLDRRQAEALQRRLEAEVKKGRPAEYVAVEFAQQQRVNVKQALSVAKQAEVDVKLRPHVEHFWGEGVEVSREAARMAAEFSEEFDKAFDLGTPEALQKAMDKSRGFLEQHAGFVPPSGTADPHDQAVHMQRIVNDLHQAALSASYGNTSSQAAQMAGAIDQLSDTLSGLLASDDPREQATILKKDEKAGQAVTSHVAQQAQVQNVRLSPEMISHLSQTLRNDIITELASNKTLSKIFGSAKFRQKIVDYIAPLNNGSEPTPSQPPSPPAGSATPEEPPARA